MYVYIPPLLCPELPVSPRIFFIHLSTIPVASSFKSEIYGICHLIIKYLPPHLRVQTVFIYPSQKYETSISLWSISNNNDHAKLIFRFQIIYRIHLRTDIRCQDQILRGCLFQRTGKILLALHMKRTWMVSHGVHVMGR